MDIIQMKLMPSLEREGMHFIPEVITHVAI